MTGWHIRPGYSSTATFSEVWKALDEVIALARKDVSALTEEGNRIGRPVPREYLEAFAKNEDATITRVKGDDPQWMLLASGGGPSRTWKENARRAFVRHVMRLMHERGLDVSIVVA